jgi:hypothetical protein
MCRSDEGEAHRLPKSGGHVSAVGCQVKAENRKKTRSRNNILAVRATVAKPLTTITGQSRNLPKC